MMLRSYPLNSEYERMLSLVVDDRQYLRAVVVFDRGQPPNKLTDQFKRALRELNLPARPPPPSVKTRSRSAVRALERLCCYRLGLLPTADRDVIADGISHLPNGLTRFKLSKARKGVKADFSERLYIMPA
jgi:hypothetical protein